MSIKQAIKKVSESPYLEIQVWADVKNKAIHPAIDAIIKNKANYALYLQNQHADLTELSEKEASQLLRRENKAVEEGYTLLAIKEFLDLLFTSVGECVIEMLDDRIGERERLKEALYKQYQLTEFYKQLYLEQLQTEELLLELLIDKLKN